MTQEEFDALVEKVRTAVAGVADDLAADLSTDEEDQVLGGPRVILASIDGMTVAVTVITV